MSVLIGDDGSPEKVRFRRYAQMLGHEHMVPIGSLPFRSHGLLLLTNDGDLSKFLSHPSARVQQTYVMRVRPAISPLNTNKAGPARARRPRGCAKGGDSGKTGREPPGGGEQGLPGIAPRAHPQWPSAAAAPIPTTQVRIHHFFVNTITSGPEAINRKLTTCKVTCTHARFSTVRVGESHNNKTTTLPTTTLCAATDHVCPASTLTCASPAWGLPSRHRAEASCMGYLRCRSQKSATFGAGAPARR
jgi:hypothetical protein